MFRYYILGMLFAVFLGSPALSESNPAQNAIEIYPPHAPPNDMTMMEQALHRRATEIAIWSMPLMNYKAMYDSLHEAVGMHHNDIVYHSEIQDWNRALPTPNNTTPYVNFFWDLRNGPIVIDIPPTEGEISLYGTIMDSWHRPIEEPATETYGRRSRARRSENRPGRTSEVRYAIRP